MTENELKILVCELFLGGDVSFPIDGDTRLLEEGICDSLGLVRLVAEMEKRVPGLKVHDQDITRENMGSISAILEFTGRIRS